MTFELPNLPTDNLYKFMALSGLAIILVSLIPQYHYHKLKLDMIRIEGETRRFRAESELYSTVLKESKKTCDEWGEIYRKKTLTEVDIMNRIAEKEYLLGVLKIEFWLSGVGLSIGVALALYGFTLWYKKLQALQDKLLQNQIKEETTQKETLKETT